MVMEWREAVHERLKEIGEALTTEVEAVLDDLSPDVPQPAVLDLTEADSRDLPPQAGTSYQ